MYIRQQIRILVLDMPMFTGKHSSIDYMIGQWKKIMTVFYLKNIAKNVLNSIMKL